MEKVNNKITPMPREIHMDSQAEAMTSISITVGSVMINWKPAKHRSSFAKIGVWGNQCIIQAVTEQNSINKRSAIPIDAIIHLPRNNLPVCMGSEAIFSQPFSAYSV